MIPDETVDRVRAEADVVGIIGEFVKLKRVGNSYRGPCPFHHGKNPNFSVTDRGYNCFKCAESGDVFSFIQKHLSLDFTETVKWVGARAGVDVQEVSRRVEAKDLREPLWEVNASAAAFFREQLWASPEARVARDYLAARGLSQADADRFGMGYAPADASAARTALAALGFSDERQRDAGLLVSNDDRPEPRCRFRKRLMFPIYDIAGHVVGFGGRVLGDSEPKYLNSPDSELFAKRTLLYGMNWAKQAVRKAERIIIVEGYFDVIRLMLAGIDEVVAPMGTALTEQHAALVRRYTPNVFLCLDSDAAGLKATFRSGDALLAAGASVQVITLPDGEDPDTFVARQGADGFERAVSAAVDIFDRKIQILERGGWFSNLRRKRAALDKLVPTIRVTTDRVLRDLYVSRTMEVAGTSREMLLEELEVGPRARRGPGETGGPPPAPKPAARSADRRADHMALGVRAERELVRMLLHQRRYVEWAAESVGPDSFVDGRYSAIFQALITGDPDRQPAELAEDLDVETTTTLQSLLDEMGGIDRAEETIEGSINALAARGVAAKLGEIDRKLPLSAADEKDGLIREKQQLAAEMQALKRPHWKGFNSHR